MDLFRPRAIPALIASALAAPVGAVECATLQGTYQFTSVSASVPGMPNETLADLTIGNGRNKLYRVDAPGSKASLNPNQPIQRPKTTPLATKVTVKHSPSGTTLVFLDGAGKSLVEMGIDDPVRWSCKGERLERSSRHTAGLGDAIRTERVDEVLERSAAGELVHRETVTVIDPKGLKPSMREARYPAAH